MSSNRVNLLVQLYVLLKKMQAQTANLNHDLLFTNTILFNIEKNPTTASYLAGLFSLSEDEITKKLSALEKEGMINKIKSDKNEDTYKLSYNGQKQIAKHSKLMLAKGTEPIDGLDENEIKTLIRLINKLINRKKLDNAAVNDYFS
ncbi:MarR family winged helix-turn-helix transcriptional regulator [Patescibacteria group bacterium]|nr:MarR family winged helix-turn-helix transcriptional regulator [Patescibacteria group bacterium]MBU1673909.1 MarR family winged helix-turn-helix transcriptional regulator [Patescibacteria group bacterium]MBU1963903.1 MarR family winged helix-turn-helix transcriptional regulator [Patescibacteria group bacterium]